MSNVVGRDERLPSHPFTPPIFRQQGKDLLDRRWAIRTREDTVVIDDYELLTIHTVRQIVRKFHEYRYSAGIQNSLDFRGICACLHTPGKTMIMDAFRNSVRSRSARISVISRS